MALSAVRAVPVTEPVKTYSLYINGQWSAAASGELADDFNPSTGALYSRVAQAGRADALRAIDAAYKAREGWARMLVADRAAILLRAADLIATRTEEIRDVLIEESGSTLDPANPVRIH